MRRQSPSTGEYYQAQDLIKRDLVSPDWKPPRVDSKGKPVKYPIKEVNEIIRKRLADGSEWVLSRQYWTEATAGNSIIDVPLFDLSGMDVIDELD